MILDFNKYTTTRYIIEKPHKTIHSEPGISTASKNEEIIMATSKVRHNRI